MRASTTKPRMLQAMMRTVTAVSTGLGLLGRYGSVSPSCTNFHLPSFPIDLQPSCIRARNSFDASSGHCASSRSPAPVMRAFPPMNEVHQPNPELVHVFLTLVPVTQIVEFGGDHAIVGLMDVVRDDNTRPVPR